MLINEYEIEMFSPPCDPGSPIWVAILKTEADLAPVMPYVNASVKNGFYQPKAPTLVWGDGVYKYSLQQNVINIKPLKDRKHAERTAKKAVDFINDIWERRDNARSHYQDTSQAPGHPPLSAPYQLLQVRHGFMHGVRRPGRGGGEGHRGLPALARGGRGGKTGRITGAWAVEAREK